MSRQPAGTGHGRRKRTAAGPAHLGRRAVKRPKDVSEERAQAVGPLAAEVQPCSSSSDATVTEEPISRTRRRRAAAACRIDEGRARILENSGPGCLAGRGERPIWRGARERRPGRRAARPAARSRASVMRPRAQLRRRARTRRRVGEAEMRRVDSAPRPVEEGDAPAHVALARAVARK